MIIIIALIFFLFSLLPFLSKGRLIQLNCRGALSHGREFDILLCILPIFFIGLIFIGFRPLDAGFDTPRYVITYSRLGSFFSAREVGLSTYGNTELLWWPLQSLLRPFVDARGWLVFNYVSIFLAVFAAYYMLCKKFSVSPLIFALVFFTYYFVYAGNAIRQAISLPLGLIAFCLFLDKRYWPSLLLLSLAIGLHWSAIFFLLTPMLTLPIFRKRWILISAPLLMLFLSFLIGKIAGIFVDFLGMPELEAKYELYFDGGRESHIGPIWTKFNFWISTLVPFLFLILCKPSSHENNALHIYVLLFLSLTMFSVTIPDFSERFFPALLLILPLIVVLMLRRLKIKLLVAELIMLLGFFGLWVTVFMSASAQETLGYHLGF